MASQAGGMEIEEVAAKTPEAIYKENIDPAVGFRRMAGAQAGVQAGVEADADQCGGDVYDRAVQGVHRDGRVADGDQSVYHDEGRQAVGAGRKINFDDNAMFRHKEIKELRDMAEEDPLEVEASKYALNYIKLDGTIACMVNGAGLAMATMDIIQYAGGSAGEFSGCGRRREAGAD